jgi:hypothetical protein
VTGQFVIKGAYIFLKASDFFVGLGYPLFDGLHSL